MEKVNYVHQNKINEVNKYMFPWEIRKKKYESSFNYKEKQMKVPTMFSAFYYFLSFLFIVFCRFYCFHLH